MHAVSRHKNLFFLLPLFFSLPIFIFLGLRLGAQLEYRRARNELLSGSIDSAIARLEKTSGGAGNELVIQKALGDGYLFKSAEASLEDAYLFATHARDAFARALAIHPDDSDAAFGLARSEARLERLHPLVNPAAANPYHAGPLFENAIRLRPGSTYLHYNYVGYLHRRGPATAFLAAVRRMAAMDPVVYYKLRKESFWSSEVRQAALLGLYEGLQSGTYLQRYHAALASLLEEEKQWEGAIEHYQLMLGHQDRLPESQNYFQMGRLYLGAEDLDGAEENFFAALRSSRDVTKTTLQIFDAYRRAELLDAFFKFYQAGKQSLKLGPLTDAAVARQLFGRNRLDLAGAVLVESLETAPSAEAYYWLARIAEKENDAHRQLMMMQKAVDIDTRNSDYHQYLAKALLRQGEAAMAEQAAGRAIAFAGKPRWDLYRNRAHIRIQRDNFQGAVEDWQTVVKLEPKKAIGYAGLADGYQRMGLWDRALAQYRKAAELEPENAHYRKKVTALSVETPAVQ